MRSLLLALTFVAGLSANAADYCLAIRGNGELAPAHWGAISGIVERLGLPLKQAGGSSASITMLMIDAIATNKYVREASPVQQGVRASLLIKSLEGYAEYLSSSSQVQDFMSLYTRARLSGTREWSTALARLLTGAEDKTSEELAELLHENRDLMIRNLRTGIELGLISERTQPQLFALWNRLSAGEDSWTLEDVESALFYVNQLVATLRTFGEFDAYRDSSIFFRQGVVDFERLSQHIGKIAEFYARGADSDAGLWDEFFSTCASSSVGRTWTELETTLPQCTSILQELIDSYGPDTRTPEFIKRPVGVTIPSFPATSVLVKSAAEEAIAGLKEYHVQRSPTFGSDFKISNPEHVKFGYWGREQDLREMQAILNKTDEKSRRFLALGPGVWEQAISLSPAEPGLSPFVPFKDAQGNDVVSAGGWSDLHPVSILRASGCPTVVYVTRRGGESLFGQGVAKRLLGFERDWKYLETSPKKKYQRNWILNNLGDATDVSSLWSRLYNVANPQSSFRQSLAQADAVLCTDWNRFDIRTGFEEMIKDSYRSPYFVRNRTAFPGITLTPQLNPQDIHPDGYPTYVGCF